MQRYTPSGVVPIGGALATVAGSLPAAVIFAFVYALVVRWIPFVYLNFLATLAFGFGMGMCVTVLSSLGKIRSPLFVRFAWLLTLVVGYYCYWAMSIWLHGGFGLGLRVFQPRAVMLFAEALFRNGSWSLFGAVISGWVLVGFWVAEVALVGWIAYLTALANVDQPFCENCNEWTETEKGVALYQATGAEPEWDNIRSGEFHALTQIPLLAASLPEYVRLDVNACPKCTGSNFLCIQHVKTTVDKDGDESTQETALIANMTLTAEQLTRVRELVDHAADAAAEAAAAQSMAAEAAVQKTANPFDPS